MTRLGDILDVDQLNWLVAHGYVNCTLSADGCLGIYSYTQKAVWERMWTPTSRLCRGLIEDARSGHLVARPFPKFFNRGEPDDDFDPSFPYRVKEKLDGSLGIGYIHPLDGKPRIATRGSFSSDQAHRGTELLNGRGLPDVGYTALFEIIYPENRTVIDYDGYEDLVLLAVIHNESGQPVPWRGWDGDRVNDVVNVNEYLSRDDVEGVVLVNSIGQLQKVKTEEYVRLHRILTGVNEKTVWEAWVGGHLEEMRRDTPEEFRSWVTSVARRFEEGADWCLDSASQVVNLARELYPDGPRKEVANVILSHLEGRQAGLAFALYDGDIEKALHIAKQMVKPSCEGAASFTFEDEAG